MTYLETLDFLKRALQGAPRDPGPVASDLRGWLRVFDGEAPSRTRTLDVCARCAGRIMARGFSSAFQGFSPVWAPNPPNGCTLH